MDCNRHSSLGFPHAIWRTQSQVGDLKYFFQGFSPKSVELTRGYYTVRGPKAHFPRGSPPVPPSLLSWYFWLVFFKISKVSLHQPEATGPLAAQDTLLSGLFTDTNCTSGCATIRIWSHCVQTIFSPAANGQKRARGRSRVCTKFYFSLFLNGLCTLIIWFYGWKEKSATPIY